MDRIVFDADFVNIAARPAERDAVLIVHANVIVKTADAQTEIATVAGG
jgi:hypothetical protein